MLKLLKKRLFSSPAAFAATLGRHLERVERLSPLAPAGSDLSEAALRRELDRLDEDTADDEALDEAEADALALAARTFAPLTAEERDSLATLKRYADRAADRADAKALALVAWLEATLRPEGAWSRERAIIFTEYRRTQNYLHDILTSHGLAGGGRLMLLYGGLPGEERERVKAAFQADPDVSPVRILLATDAASEGIDLQNHCSRLIHYEIPWNPTRLEQRNGRIDRHGQRADEVSIHHFVGQGYREIT